MIEVHEILEFDEQFIDTIMHFEKEVFDEPFPREKIEERFKLYDHFISLFAFKNGELVGYKIGYQKNPRLFYSWIGGVLTNARGEGVAKALMEKQHELAKQRGYKVIRTETQNRFKPMLVLNLKFGFDIIGTYKSDQDQLQTIILEKSL